MISLIRPSLVLFIALSAVTGLLYPFSLIGLGAQFYPAQANGSLLLRNHQPIGSALIGQAFVQPHYFWSRPSATATRPYNASASGGSNLALSNPAWLQAVQQRVTALKALDPDNSAPIPIDLVTASGSGLDPHISLAAAQYQMARIARLRLRSLADIQNLIDAHTEHPIFGFLGAARVNVLALNLALDALQP